jgi:5-amino-6-(5-phosphoribosylamino)uracil reductase
MRETPGGRRHTERRPGTARGRNVSRPPPDAGDRAHPLAPPILSALRRLLPEPPGRVEPVDAYADLPTAAGRPGLRLNMVASIDGAISVDGRSGGLGGGADRRVYLALRALTDVVLVAAGTVRAEGYGPAGVADELAAGRRARGQAPAPRIAVVSRSLSLDWEAPLFAEARPDATPIIVTCASAPATGLRDAERAGAEVLVAGDSEVDLPAALAALGQRGARSLLAEGGPRLNAALAAADLIDEICTTVSPLLAGGGAGRALDGPEPRPGGRPMRLWAVYEEEGFLFMRHRAAR